jgi:hypothetical protein
VRKTNGDGRTCLEEEVERPMAGWGRNQDAVEFNSASVFGIKFSTRSKLD